MSYFILTIVLTWVLYLVGEISKDMLALIIMTTSVFAWGMFLSWVKRGVNDDDNVN